jgi:hypothetical protein
MRDPQPTPHDTGYVSAFESDVPIIVQHARLEAVAPNSPCCRPSHIRRADRQVSSKRIQRLTRLRQILMELSRPGAIEQKRTYKPQSLKLAPWTLLRQMSLENIAWLPRRIELFRRVLRPVSRQSDDRELYRSDGPFLRVSNANKCRYTFLLQ